MPRSVFHRSLEMQVALQHLQTLMLFVSTQDWMLIIQLDPRSIQCFFFFPLNSANVTACDWICSLILIFQKTYFRCSFPLPPWLFHLFFRGYLSCWIPLSKTELLVFWGVKVWGCSPKCGIPWAGDKGHERVWGEAAGCAWAASFLGEQWDKKNSFGQVKWRKPLGYVWSAFWWLVMVVSGSHVSLILWKVLPSGLE